MQYIARHATVDRQSYEGTIARIEGAMPANRIDQLRQFGDDVRVVSETAP